MSQTFSTVDMHTCGEPVRIVTAGYPPLPGLTILAQRRAARDSHDAIRRTLMLEPRGHAGMYGVIPVPVTAPDADLAVLFMHNEGYSTMCGHATVAIGRWAVDSGLVPQDQGKARFRLQIPCGVVSVEVRPDAAGGSLVAFDSVDSFASHLDVPVDLPGHGQVMVDVAFGGAYYAIVPASRLGLSLQTSGLATLTEVATRITDILRARLEIVHPTEPDLSFLYGTILTDDHFPGSAEPTFNLCIFAEGQIDRSPTGSGVSARMALAHARDQVRKGARARFLGLTGTGFDVELVETSGEGLSSRSTIRVEGTAHYSARSEFIVESFDPLPQGFALPAQLAAFDRGVA